MEDLLKAEIIEVNETDSDFFINIDEFDYDSKQVDYDIYGIQETERRLKGELGLDDESNCIKIYNEMKEQMLLEESRKKERNRLYKTDKKCYNLNNDDKNCQNCEKMDKTKNRIYTRVNIRKIKKLLTYKDITHAQLSEALNISERTLSRKLNVYNDLTANELITVSEMLGVDINELIYKNKH